MIQRLKKFATRKLKQEAIKTVEHELLHTGRGRKQLGRFLGKIVLKRALDSQDPKIAIQVALKELLIEAAEYADLSIGDLAYISERITIELRDAAISQMGAEKPH